MSAEAMSTRSGVFAALNARRLPSGDHDGRARVALASPGPLRAGDRRAERVGDVNGPDLRVGVVAVHDLEVPEVLRAPLARLRLGLGRDERDLPAVGRPREIVDAGLGLGQLDRFAAIGGDREDLVALADPRAGEGEPLAVGRPARCARGLAPAGQLIRRAAVLGASQICVTKASWSKSASVTV